MLSNSLRFFQAFLKSPRVVASLVPSSPLLERRVVRAARLGDAELVVELGSGTGGTTRAMLEDMGPGARLLAFERTAELADALGGIDDDRLDVVNGCASRLCAELSQRNLGASDVVVSGIPFSNLPPELARDIVRQVHAGLKPGGRFIAYQVSDRVAKYATPVFGEPSIEHELCNIPPLRVFIWRKN